VSKPAKPLTAAQRTVPMALVDMREQRDRNAPRVTGPAPRRWSLEGGGTLSLPPATHLVRLDRLGWALCGEYLGKDRGEHKKICEKCRVEASRIGGVIRP
jgi:hypothetical protein